MPFFRERQAKKLRCPYDGCGKEFDKPTMITDTSVFPRETHYVCPYCMATLELVTKDTKIVEVNQTKNPVVFDSAAKCPQFSDFSSASIESMLSKEKCLTCPNVTQCGMYNKKSH